MLRFDRYLVAHDRTLDLASGQYVTFKKEPALRRSPRHQRSLASSPPAIFTAHDGHALIDVEVERSRRVEVWEPWSPGPAPKGLASVIADFSEALDVARLGAPRAFDAPPCSARQHAYLRRVLAREARLRGFVPIALDCLAALVAGTSLRLPAWLADRSCALFVDVPAVSRHAAILLLELARRDARPHVLIRTLRHDADPVQAAPPMTIAVHEELEAFGGGEAAVVAMPDAKAEAAARWLWLLERLARERATPDRTLRLAQVLAARDQPFEARALLETLATEPPPWGARAATVLSDINERAAARAGGWDMVDDFVDVLRLCQDTEDEQTALARVGAFVRDRLQASSVAFLVREGTTPRVLTRVGSTAAAVDLAAKTIETGLPIAPAQPVGPVEATAPVRHASDVIGALWCRWSAGVPIAPRHASALLGVAAAAAAPSLRLAVARSAPITRINQVPELVGESAAMAAVREAILRAAASPFPVIIEGESGSGKELAARAIHSRSSRRDRRFAAINCAALVDDLFEAELFGHVRGAFTGANTDRPGLFEDANGGTLFLDEIAELGARVQAKLLRVLQEGEVRRVGETIVRKVDVRIVAATNRPLAAEVSGGTFRADLWYRIDVVRITLPPLRERIEDVPLLVQHLWRTLAARTGSRAALSPTTIAALAAYDWPGNIRELQNVLASLLVSAPRAGLIGPAALPGHIARVSALDRGATLSDARKQFEERYVRAALARAGGRVSTAARDLGVSRQGLSKLMGRLGIEQSAIRSI